jgi:hypothetical protein
MYGLCNDGLGTEDGAPRSLIDACIFSSSAMSDTAFMGVKGWFLNMLTTIVAAYGRWIGREAELVEKYYNSESANVYLQ